MAKTLSLSGISTGNPISPPHVSQSVDAFTGTDAYDITISGSLTVTGSTNISGSVDIEGGVTGSFTGSFVGTVSTASVATTVDAQYKTTAGGFAQAFMKLIAGGAQLSSGTVTITEWSSTGTSELVGKTLGTDVFITAAVSGSGGAGSGHLEIDVDSNGNIIIDDGGASSAEVNFIGMYLS